jgi:bacteriorhodopsin
LIATWIVALLIPTTNLTWALFAVGFATFFGALASYIAGQRRDSTQVRT